MHRTLRGLHVAHGEASGRAKINMVQVPILHVYSRRAETDYVSLAKWPRNAFKGAYKSRGVVERFASGERGKFVEEQLATEQIHERKRGIVRGRDRDA